MSNTGSEKPTTERPTSDEPRFTFQDRAGNPVPTERLEKNGVEYKVLTFSTPESEPDERAREEA